MNKIIAIKKKKKNSRTRNTCQAVHYKTGGQCEVKGKKAKKEKKGKKTKKLISPGNQGSNELYGYKE